MLMSTIFSISACASLEKTPGANPRPATETQNVSPEVTERESAYLKNINEFLNFAVRHCESYPELEIEECLRNISHLIGFTGLYCQSLYPKPTFEKCHDSAYHGIAGSSDPHSKYLNADEVEDFLIGMGEGFGGLGIEVAKPSRFSSVVIIGVLKGFSGEKAGCRQIASFAW